MNNGLTLSTISSEVQTGILIDKLDEIKSYINENSMVVAYLDDVVLIGKYSKGAFEFYKDRQPEKEFIQKIRIFNEKKELLLWRSGNKIKGRLRTDNLGEKADIIEARQILFGTNIERLGNGFVRLFEKRGTEIIMPDMGFTVDDKEKRIAIKTRNYIDPDNMQATYIDSRFVEFIQMPEGK